MMTILQNKTPLKIPLRFVLAIPFILVIVLTTSVVGYIAFMNGQKAVNNVANQLHGEVSARIDEHLHNFLIVPLQVNQFNTVSMQQGWLDPKDIKKTQDYFLEQVKTNKTITSIYFGNVDGGIVGGGREGATESFYVYNTENLKAGTFNKYALTNTGQIGKLLASVPNLDARTRPWYINAAKKGAITWNDMYILLTGQDMTIALSSPVYDERHSLIGVLSVEIFVSQIENFLETLKISETGQSFIMERSGLLVASSTGGNSFIKNNDKMERIDALNSQSPMIKYAAEYLRARFGENYDVAADVQFDFEINGKRFFANVSPVHDQYGIDWLIIVVIPESDFMAEITATNQSTFLITILALGISILASIFGAGRIASRISYLNKSTREFTRGEGTGFVSANSRISEIDELTNSFTEMERQLTQTLNDLKSEVSERKTIGQALHESESLFRAIFEQAAVGVAQIETATGRFVRINQKYCDIVGYSRAEMEKINFQTITHPDDLEVDLANLELLTAGEIREFTMEKRYFKKSGETIWVSLTSSPMWAAGETPNYHIAIVHDITARKQTETERQTLLEIMQGLVVTKDLHDFLGIIHNSIAKVIYAENFFVLLYNKDTGLFEEIYSVDKFDPPGSPSRLEKSISAYVFKSGQPYLMTQARFDELAARGEVELVGANSPSWLGVPLKAPGKETALRSETIGVMVVQDYDKPNSYTERDIDFLSSIAGQVALVIKRKQAEEALLESEERYRTLVETADDVIIMTDLQGKHLFRNNAYYTSLGFDVEEDIELEGFARVHPDDQPAIRSGMNELLQKGDGGGEYRVQHKNGRWLHRYNKSKIIRDKDGQPQAILSIIRDVTERKQMEQNLLVNEARYRTLFEQSPDGIVILNPETAQLIEFNDQACRQLGYTRDEFGKLTLKDIEAIETIEESLAHIQMIIRDGYDDFETRQRTKQGEVRDVHVTAKLIDAGGIPIYHCIWRDITERKQTEEMLRTSEENLLAILNATHDSACLVDTDGRYIFLNESLAKGLGKSVSELIGTLSTESVPEAVAETRLAYLKQVVQSGKPLEFDNSRDDRHFSIRYWPVIDVQGHTKTVAVFASDITARVQADEALRQADAKYRNIFENTIDGIFQTTPAGKFFTANPALARMLGYDSPEELIAGLNDLNSEFYVQPARREEFMRLLSDYGMISNFESEVHRKDGSTIWISENAKTVCNDLGQILYYEGTLEDITARKQAEDLLVQTRQNYEIFFNTIDEFLFVLDEQGNIIHTNTTVIDRLGYTSEELFGKSVLMLHPPERREETGRIVAEMLSGVTEFCPVPIVTKSGVQIPVETRVSHGFWNGKPVIFGVTKDISKVRLSEEKFSKLFHLNPSACGLSDLVNRKYVELNEAFYTLLGFDKDEVIGKTASDLGILPPDALKSLSLKADSNGSITNAEADLRAKNGDIKHVLLSAENITVQDKKYRFTIVHDITERVKADKALRESEEKHRYLVENIHDIIYTLSPDGVLTFVSPAWTALLGHPLEQVTGQLFQQFVHPDDIPVCMVFLRAVIESGQRQDGIEYRVRHIDGSWRWHTTSAVPLIDEAGAVIGFNGIARDITERKRMDAALRENEKRFRYISAVTSDIAYSCHTDENGCFSIDWMTGAASLITGYSIEEITAQSCWRFLVIKDDGAIFDENVIGLAPGSQDSCELRIRHKNGSIVWISSFAKCVSDPQTPGRLWLYGGLVDITARKQAEDALRKSESRLRSILDATPFPIALVDVQDNNIYFWSQSALALFGHTAPTAPEWYQIAYPNPDYRSDVIKRWKPMLEKARLTNQAVNTGEYRVTCRDGSVRICELYAAFLADSLIVTFNDITERKMADEKLRSSEEQYRILFDHLPIPAFTKDINGVYTSCNEENLKYWAINPVGHTDAEVSPNEIGLALHANDQRAIESGETVVADELLKSTPLGDRLFITHKVPLRDGSGNIIGVLGASLDITERKRADDEMLEKSKELEALFTISSHLRTAQTADDMLPVVLAQMSQVLDADANAVILLNPDQTSFTFAICDGLLTSSAGSQFGVENSVSGRILQTRQPYVTLDYANDPLRSGVILDGAGIGTMVVVPLQSETEFIGTLLCGRAKYSHTRIFTDAEVQLLVSIGEMVGNALRRTRLYEDALLRLQRVQGLHSIDSFINANRDIKVTLKLIVTQAISLMKVDAAAILYYDQNLHILEYASAQGFHYKAIEKTRFELSGAFSEKAILERRVVTASDLSEIQDPVHKEMMQKEGCTACFVTPMIAKGKVIGVLELYNRAPLHSNQEWLEFLESIGAQAAIAIDNARLFRDLQTSNFELVMAYDATIQGWSRALEMRDRETEGHTLRVTETTVGIAKLAGLNEKEITRIRRGALLHDIGKMGIPDNILNKIGKLTSKEWDIIRQHPQKAYDMLRDIEYLRPMLEIPYCHHEKWNGTGYPQGLQGLQIPYAARLFAVVDVWDALTSDRVYRKAWSKKKTIAHIKEQSGKHFDPQAVELFLKYMDELAEREK